MGSNDAELVFSQSECFSSNVWTFLYAELFTIEPHFDLLLMLLAVEVLHLCVKLHYPPGKSVGILLPDPRVQKMSPPLLRLGYLTLDNSYRSEIKVLAGHNLKKIYLLPHLFIFFLTKAFLALWNQVTSQHAFKKNVGNKSTTHLLSIMFLLLRSWGKCQNWVVGRGKILSFSSVLCSKLSRERRLVDIITPRTLDIKFNLQKV